MKRLVLAPAMIGTMTAVALGTPYWIEYNPANGNSPEAEAWSQYTSAGGAERWFEEGALIIDSRAITMITDSYSMARPGALDPGPSEVFSMRWTLRTDQLQGPWDPGVAVFSDSRMAVFLDFTLTGVHEPGQGIIATFEPGVFHDFELRSEEMLTYDLYIDGAHAHSGVFLGPLLNSSTVMWGDETQGGASLSRWGGFSFAVLPEGHSVWLVLAISSAVQQRARAR